MAPRLFRRPSRPRFGGTKGRGCKQPGAPVVQAHFVLIVVLIVVPICVLLALRARLHVISVPIYFPPGAAHQTSRHIYVFVDCFVFTIMNKRKSAPKGHQCGGCLGRQHLLVRGLGLRPSLHGLQPDFGEAGFRLLFG